jgi:hypothetical protein
LAVCFASGAWAAPKGVTYVCEMRGHPSHGFVAPRLLLSVSDDQKRGAVLDAVIREMNAKPLSMPIRPVGKGRFRYQYTIRNMPAKGTAELTATYTVNLDTRRNRVTMRVFVHGYDNQPAGTGRCELVAG